MLRPMGRYATSDRVRKRTDYLRIQQAGHRVVSPGFVFMLQRSAPGQNPRLGITASRRVGNAVERNRAKRLVREAFRAVRSTWPAGFDVVVIVRQALGNTKLGAVVAEWQAARGRIIRRFEQLPEAEDLSVVESAREGRASVAGAVAVTPAVRTPSAAAPARGSMHASSPTSRSSMGAEPAMGGSRKA
jgi:ribonuclease P protein component